MKQNKGPLWDWHPSCIAIDKQRTKESVQRPLLCASATRKVVRGGVVCREWLPLALASVTSSATTNPSLILHLHNNFNYLTVSIYVKDLTIHY